MPDVPDVSPTMPTIPAPSGRRDGLWTPHADSEAISEVLARAKVLRRIHGVEEVGSTQDLALALARDGAPAGTVVLVDRQVRGRGRRGRRWDDVPGGGSLALTVLLDAPPRGASVVPLAAGLAVVDAVTRLADVVTDVPTGTREGELALKWPNDVVVRSAADVQGMMLRKLAGILVEREKVASREVLLVGIGLNVDHRALPPRPDRICLAALRGTPSLVSETVSRSEREAILAGLLATLDVRFEQLLGDPVRDATRGPEGVLRDYRRVSDTIGRQVDVDLPGGGRLEGTVKDVDADGALIVEVDGRTEVVVAGTLRARGSTVEGDGS